MYPDLNKAQQSGFGLPTAIFILVIMSLLAAAMVRLVSTQALTIADETLSTRAFYAAESGAQFGVNRLFQPNGGSSCAASTLINFGTPGLNNCQVVVECAGIGSFNGIPHYTVTSTGSCGNSARVIQVRARQRNF